MARNERHIPVDPQRVFDVLADPRQYGYVVVGSKHIRHWDDDWPAKGSKFHHTVGFGALSVKDSTYVVRSEPPHELELIARALPLGKAKVTFQLEASDGGTRATIIEDPLVPRALHLLMPPVHALTLVRNRETLRRLEEVSIQSPAERERTAVREGAAT
jgi:uncharacterized protein YndB with AHSA1/START domain